MSEVVQIGQILAGKYRVERVLGQGGMGVVVAATHLQLGQLFALKFLLPHMCEHGEAVARFAREARAAVQIQSEHVARVSDVGTLETGAPYMVMEYLQGSDLSDVLQTRGPMPIAEAVGFVLQACEAIAEAHSLGIVHRDLKPANLFLTRRRDGSPLVKVLDFGISKALQESFAGSAPSVTSTTAVMGSPLYMSPEQVRSSKQVDARSDVWALGVILQELITGHPTYVAETASALMAMIAADPPPPLRARRPDAPPQLEAAVLRCLEKDRERRMPNVAELARALAPFAAPEARASVERISRVLGDAAPQSMPQVSYEPGRSVASGGGTAGTWERTQTGSRPKRGALVVVVGLALGVGVAVAGLLAWRAHSGNESEATHGADASSQLTAAAPPPSAVTAVAPPVVAPPVVASVSPVATAEVPAPAPSVSVSAQPPARRRPAPTRRGGQPDLFDDNK